MRSVHARPDLRFSWFLTFVGLLLLGTGAWGIYQGMVTLKWPRAPAVIRNSTLRLRESDPSPSSVRARNGQQEVTASVAIQYEYTVGGQTYVGDAIEVADFGFQNSAAARKQHDKYPPGATV